LCADVDFVLLVIQHISKAVLRRSLSANTAATTTGLGFLLLVAANYLQYILSLIVFFAMAIGIIMLYVCLSVRLSVTLCIVTKGHILQQKCPNRWIGNALLGTWQHNFEPPTLTLNPQTPKVVDHCLAVRLLESIIALLWDYWSWSFTCCKIIGVNHC